MDRVITYPVPSGVPTLEDLKKETYLRGADINFSENVLLEGVTVMNPAHYSVHLGAQGMWR